VGSLPGLTWFLPLPLPLQSPSGGMGRIINWPQMAVLREDLSSPPPFPLPYVSRQPHPICEQNPHTECHTCRKSNTMSELTLSNNDFEGNFYSMPQNLMFVETANNPKLCGMVSGPFTLCHSCPP